MRTVSRETSKPRRRTWTRCTPDARWSMVNAPVLSVVAWRSAVALQTSAPIAGADVWSATADRHATTDSTGAFTIDHLASGVHLVQVRRLGFDVSRDTVRISAEHENVRTYALAVQAARLDTVRTRA